MVGSFSNSVITASWNMVFFRFFSGPLNGIGLKWEAVCAVTGIPYYASLHTGYEGCACYYLQHSDRGFVPLRPLTPVFVRVKFPQASVLRGIA